MNGATCKPWLGLGLKAPVGPWVGNGEKITHGDFDLEPVVFTPRLDQQDTLTTLRREPIGQKAACASSANNDGVKLKGS